MRTVASMQTAGEPTFQAEVSDNRSPLPNPQDTCLEVEAVLPLTVLTVCSRLLSTVGSTILVTLKPDTIPGQAMNIQFRLTVIAVVILKKMGMQVHQAELLQLQQKLHLSLQKLHRQPQLPQSKLPPPLLLPLRKSARVEIAAANPPTGVESRKVTVTRTRIVCRA